MRSVPVWLMVFSALQPDAANITHFSRTPQWVMWMPMAPRQPRVIAWVLRMLPRLERIVDWGQRFGSDVDLVTRPTWRRRLAQGYARLCLRVQVRDKDIRSRLTPDYQPFCKRQVISGSYARERGVGSCILAGTRRRQLWYGRHCLR